MNKLAVLSVALVFSLSGATAFARGGGAGSHSGMASVRRGS